MSTTTTAPSNKKYTFGIPLYNFQAVDVVGPIDLIYSTSRELLLELESTGLMPPDLADHAIDVEFVYLAPTLEPVKLASGLTFMPTATFATCPKLTCLLLGGPGPDFFNHIPDSYVTFLREKLEEVEFLFTTCTGGIVAAKAGLLKGTRATTNWEFLDLAKAECPGTEWVKERWVVDGKIWTAGGAFAGVDMFEFWLEGKRGEALKELGRRALDYQPRGLDGEILRD
ncbi:putative ThiJ/PfpI family transcriptional regulator [Aspergillus steynii IBT 23096]|uniref:Putative ThiJ/PfpI family transcriptional regulator n=1 Tax=Aspergillus steynii IBT 23096 TaxID=1392250 RepID=A0A2I2GFI2_9EURO|nr:putative ThiJ/PfpI family transcriptional regulator [Aspergillus steynii IBT 23096]PLB51639.1 putative ThiJ/PfpI family transcriptional regulator [Aspergillus steynii IBT 23096]